MSGVENVAKQFILFDMDEVREFQRYMARHGLLVSVVAIPKTWRDEIQYGTDADEKLTEDLRLQYEIFKLRRERIV